MALAVLFVSSTTAQTATGGILGDSCLSASACILLCLAARRIARTMWTRCVPAACAHYVRVPAGQYWDLQLFLEDLTNGARLADIPTPAKNSFLSVASQWLPGKHLRALLQTKAALRFTRPACADNVSVHATPNGSQSETTDPGAAKWAGWYATALPGGPVPDLPSVQDVWQVWQVLASACVVVAVCRYRVLWVGLQLRSAG